MERLSFTDPDGAYAIEVGGVFALDYRSMDDRNAEDSELRVGRAVVRVDGELGDSVRFRIAPDLHGIDTEYGMDEAWAAYQPSDGMRLSGGLMEIPQGFEASFEEEDLSFIGYGFPVYLSGLTDWALRWEHEIKDGLLYYDAVASVGEGFDTLGEIRDSPQYSARFVTYPLYDKVPDPSWWSGLFLGASLAYIPDFQGRIDVMTPMRNKLFFTEDLRADRAYFFHVNFGIDGGPLRFHYEVIRGEGTPPSGSGFEGLDTPEGGEADLDQVGAWGSSLSWMITGESYDSRPFHVRENGGKRGQFPAHPLWGGSPEEQGLGAFELALRYNNADIDRQFFTLGFTDEMTSSQEFRTMTAALNWYPTSSLRASAEVVRIIADQQPAALENGDRDTSFIFRVQYQF